MFVCGPAFFSGASGTNGNSPHRYWGIRINSTAVAGNWPAYGDMSFHAVDGGPNLAVGNLLLTTGSFYVSQNLGFDAMIGDSSRGTADGAQHNVAHPNASVVIDYADLGTPVAVNQFRLMALDAPYVAGMPGSFDIVYSDDAATWTTAWSVTGQTGWTQAEIRTFNAPTYTPAAYTGSKYGAHKYWRTLFLANSGGAVYGFGELEMRATPGGATQCAGGTASASSTFSGLSPANLFDGTASTVWGNASGVGLCHWVEYAFPSPVSVGQVAMRARNDAGYPQAPTDVIVEFSDDDTKWHYAWHFTTPANWTQNELRTFTDPNYV